MYIYVYIEIYIYTSCMSAVSGAAYDHLPQVAENGI